MKITLVTKAWTTARPFLDFDQQFLIPFRVLKLLNDHVDFVASFLPALVIQHGKTVQNLLMC